VRGQRDVQIVVNFIAHTREWATLFWTYRPTGEAQFSHLSRLSGLSEKGTMSCQDDSNSGDGWEPGFRSSVYGLSIE
jgi:hypothetical protein